MIRFTTDGSSPTPEHGETYRGPWTIKQTTVLRVAAFMDGKATSQTSTHSYLFIQSTLNQPARPKGYPNGAGAWQGEPSAYAMDPRVVADPRYRDQMGPALRALPSVSVVCPHDDLFGANQGLYQNTEARGPAWEKTCSLEWIETNGASGFQIDCGLRMQGNTGRIPDKTPKHSFRVLFKSQYGSSKLRYPVFPDSTVHKFDTLVLRADYNNAWTHWKPEDNRRSQRTRDAWLKDSQRDMGWLAPHARYVHLYLNGLYWGIYDVAERPDAHFAASYLGGEPEDYDVVDDSGAKQGSSRGLREIAPRSQRKEPLTLDQVASKLDVTQFIDYLLLNYYAGNRDWGEHKNWYAIRDRKNGDRFRYYVWDGEIILQSPKEDIVNAPPQSPFYLARRLAADAEYRLLFADRVQKHCFGNGALTPAATSTRWLHRAREVKLAILAESARWGYYRRDPPYNRDDDWNREQRRLMLNYFPQRTETLLQQLRSAGLYPEVAAPAVSVVGSETDGLFTATLSGEPDGQVYYTTDGVDPRLPISGEPSKSAFEYKAVFPIKPESVLKIRARRGPVWSALHEYKIR